MIRSKRELFEKARERWPLKVDIIGIYPNGGPIKTKPSLLEIYRKIESSIDIYDNWNQLSVWAFNQAICKLSRYKFNRSEQILFSKDVSFRSFNTMMIGNLSDESWEEERAIYSKLP